MRKGTSKARWSRTESQLEVSNPESKIGWGRRCLNVVRHLGRVRRRREHRESAKGNGEAGGARNGLPAGYWKACELARDGRYEDARAAYLRLARALREAQTPAFGRSFRMISRFLTRCQGKFDDACDQWRGVIEADKACLPARLNFGLVRAEMSFGRAGIQCRKPKRKFEARNSKSEWGGAGGAARREPRPVRIAVLSLLFNWPSTGGGNMHSAGLVEFLGRDGFEVRHFYARYEPWGIGRVTQQDGERGAEGGGKAETFGPGDGGVETRTRRSEGLEFGDGEWNVGPIRERFRAAVDSFAPDYVVISDTWNMKPHLAEAMRGYPTILLMQAQECLCPLNNLRLLGVGPVKAEQCPRNQLATPQVCHQCLGERGQHSGALHQVERALAGVGTAEYDALMRQVFYDAEAVLVLNPITAGAARAIRPPRLHRAVGNRSGAASLGACQWCWGRLGCQSFGSGGLRVNDCTARREPRPPGEDVGSNRRTTLFMAAVAGEVIKGFHVAHEACRILRETRSDFELVVTFDPAGPIDEFTRSVGWCSQDALPGHYRAADICLVPTIAQDALSITSVEAMAAGRAVIASRIGGLPYTVSDGLTGLLFEPGNAFDLAEKIGRLLDEPRLRKEMGLAGRRRFEEDFMWPDVIERYWRPLLPNRVSAR